jgi:hypothetical protein
MDTSDSVNVSGSETSYFSAPEGSLDPSLFEGIQLKSWVRNAINSILLNYLSEKYMHSEYWVHAWLAGSGVSYQWSASRHPGDLDCLLGVDYVEFRKANPAYVGLSDVEISKQLNEEFRTDVMPHTADWEGYELTFYVNPGATDIRVINPYAAYDLTHDDWTVFPDKGAHAPANSAWSEAVNRDHKHALETVTRYSQALTDLRNAPNDAARRNAETRLHMAVDMGSALFDEIHEGRRRAFSTTGEGYSDFHNYRWQSGKRLGTVPALKTLKEYQTTSKENINKQTYGIELPDTDTLIRRAATYRAQG